MKIQDSPNRFSSVPSGACYPPIPDSDKPMPDARPLTFLCITTYEKGQEFMRECKRQGCRVVLLTAEKLRNADWPRESLDDTFYLPEDIPLPDIVNAVSHLEIGRASCRERV